MTLILGVVPDIHFASLLLADKLGILERNIAIKRVEFAVSTGELARAQSEEQAMQALVSLMV